MYCMPNGQWMATIEHSRPYSLCIMITVGQRKYFTNRIVVYPASLSGAPSVKLRYTQNKTGAVLAPEVEPFPNI